MALPGAEFAPDDTTTEAIEKQESDYAPVSVTVKEQSGSIVMRTDGLTVEADQATAALAYYSSDGALLTQNTPEAMSYDRAGEGKSVRFVRDAGGGEEHFFGLGSSGEGNAFNTIDWRNKTYELWLKDANVHAVTPLYYSTAGYGIYLHSAYHGQMSFEKDNYGIDIDGGELDYYFFCGASMKEMLGDFTELSGYMNMPPKYALGVTLRGQSIGPRICSSTSFRSFITPASPSMCWASSRDGTPLRIPAPTPGAALFPIRSSLSIGCMPSVRGSICGSILTSVPKVKSMMRCCPTASTAASCILVPTSATAECGMASAG